MKLTSPNDVKRPDKPNVDHIIEEIEKKFENEDYIQCTEEFIEIKLQINHANMDLIREKYISNGWKNVSYRVIPALLNNDTKILIKFYF